MVLCYIPKRFILVFLGHIGFFILYSLRVNLSVAIVAMVKTTDIAIVPTIANNTLEGEFDWDENEQGYILSSFFYGYLITQIPGGWLASKFGGKHVMGGGIIATAILTLFTPLAAEASIYWLIVVRVLEGMTEGVIFPAMHAMMGQWAPPNELSRFTVLCYSGILTGTIITLPITGILAGSTFLGGWPSAFYVFGIVGVIWYVFWLIFIYDTPDDHPSISIDELEHIRSSFTKRATTNATKVKVPWKDIFTSLPVWAITVAHFSHNWVLYMVLTGLPLYFSEVLKFDLQENGFLSALPFIVSLITYMLGGVASDFLRERCLSTVGVRRLAAIVAFYPGALFLLLAAYSNKNQIALTVTYMVLAVSLLSINDVGYLINHIDISPRFSGVLMGFSNTAGTAAGCIVPVVTGYLTNEDPSQENYRKVFIIAAVICIVGGTFYNIFAKGTIQPWNDPPETNMLMKNYKRAKIPSETTPLFETSTTNPIRYDY